MHYMIFFFFTNLSTPTAICRLVLTSGDTSIALIFSLDISLKGHFNFGFKLCIFSPRALSAQNPPLQQHPALDAELLGHLDQCVPAHLQRQALPKPQTLPQEARTALQTDVLHGVFPTATGKTCIYCRYRSICLLSFWKDS